MNSQNVLCFFNMLHTDYSKGFGGKFGVQKDRQDKSAAGWDHIEKMEKHESQKGALAAHSLCTDPYNQFGLDIGRFYISVDLEAF